MWTIASIVDGEERRSSVESEEDARAGAAQMVAGGGYSDVRLLDPESREIDFSADTAARRAWLQERSGQVGL